MDNFDLQAMVVCEKGPLMKQYLRALRSAGVSSPIEETLMTSVITNVIEFKIPVVFFVLTGNTKSVARIIEAMKGDYRTRKTAIVVISDQDELPDADWEFLWTAGTNYVVDHDMADLEKAVRTAFSINQITATK